MKTLSQWSLLGILLVLFFVAGGFFYVLRQHHANFSSYKEGIAWKTSYPESLREAKSKHRFLFVDFYANWCGFCKQMEKVTYRNPLVIKLSRNFVCTKVNVDQETELAREFHIDGLPTLLFLEPKKGQIKKIEGYLPPDELARVMTRVVSSK